MWREDSRLSSHAPPYSPSLSMRKLVWEHLAVDVKFVGMMDNAEILDWLLLWSYVLMRHHCNGMVTLLMSRC